MTTALLAVSLLAACGVKGTKPEADASVRAFPAPPAIPAMITGQEEIYGYLADHFWDAFLDGSYRCDSLVVNGVDAGEVESAVGRYVTILETFCPRPKAEKAVAGFFRKISGFQEANPDSNVFGFFEEMIPKYLYDPNSPVRDEDLYRPFVQGLSSSLLADPGLRESYSRDAVLCALNQVGAPAADIVFTRLDGKVERLSGIRAEKTLLFFSNPFCPACEDVIARLEASGRIEELVSSGRLAVVNIYIDNEIDKWASAAAAYPALWHSGYDQDYKIRRDLTYNVRAIPSLYVLDGDKTVLMKDAPVEKVVPYLENI